MPKRPHNSKKDFSIATLGILLATIAFLGMTSLDGLAQIQTTLLRKPLRSAVAIVNEAASPMFMEKIKLLSDKYYFAIRIDPTDESGKHILVEMWRYDIHMEILNPFPDVKEYRIALYETCGDTKIPLGAVDAVMNGFKSELSNIDGISYSE